MSPATPSRTLLVVGVVAWLGAAAQAGIIVRQNLGSGAASWPGDALISTTSAPDAQSTAGESFSAATLGQTFTMPAGGNRTLRTIDLYVGGGTGTDAAAPVTVNLYDLGAIAAPEPDTYVAGVNLLGGGRGVPITYAPQPAGLVRLDFTGPDQITLGAGRTYVFELAGTPGTTPLRWYRTLSDTYRGGAAYWDGGRIFESSYVDFALAIEGTATAADLAPATCTVNASAPRQKIDGFGAGVVFLNNGITRLTDAQMDLLYGTSGTQAGLTLLRVRIAPDGDNADNLADAQKAHARGARILATPWTPPAAMKDNHSTMQGSLLPSQYGAFVAYLNSYAATMAANGAPLAVISLQNEPDFAATYESCLWTPEQLRTFCRDYAGAITVPVMMPESMDFDQSLSDPTLNDPLAAGNIDYVGGHLYGAVIRDYPLARSRALPVWMTEYLVNDQTIDTAVATGRQISDCLAVGNMSAYLWWKCIGDANGLLNAAGVPQPRSYVLAQFSRFVRPGDYRVDVPANTGTLGITAFTDAPSGRFAIVAVNNTTAPVTQAFSVQGVTLTSLTPYVTSRTQSLEAQAPVAVTDSAFSYAIPATAVVTFAGVVGPASPGGGSGSPSPGGSGPPPAATGGGGGGAIGAPFLVALGLLAALRLIGRRRQESEADGTRRGPGAGKCPDTTPAV
jgi:glucuronoarabinoxylan endo-1,4-beta-xylanase